MTGAKALEGLRVLEWAGGTAAAYCCKILSDLGAEVLRVGVTDKVPRETGGPSPSNEDQGNEDRDNEEPGNQDLMGLRALYLSTGKRQLVRHEEPGVAYDVGRLAAVADVVVTDELTATEVGLADPLPTGTIHCSITPFGLTGPYSGYRGSHITVFQSGGEGHLMPSGAGWELFPDRPPLQLGSEIGLFDTGANAAVAILAAVYRQRECGQGEVIDVSAQESQLTLNRTRLSRFNNDGIEMRRSPSGYGAGGMLECSDGRIQLVGVRPEHWEKLAASPEGADLARAAGHPDGGDADVAVQKKALVEWCQARPRAEAVRVLAAAGCPVGAYCKPEDLANDPQLLHREFFQTVDDRHGRAVPLPGAPYRMSATPVVLSVGSEAEADASFTKQPSRSVAEPGTRGRPLEGIRVVDFTWAAAGPYATLLLALLGAEVIKIETARRPDPARRGFLADYGGVDKSPNFSELNMGKKAARVNLAHPEGLAYVRRLIATSDVVVDNFRPGVMARYRLDAASLLSEHPTLVVASSSANGSTGPDALGAGLASIFGATGGLCEQTGYRDGPPTEVGESTDYRSANALAVAILAALVHRQRTGEGQSIDVASREVVIATSPDAFLAHVGGVDHELRSGNDHPVLFPHDVFPCSGDDEWVAVAVLDEQGWSGLCALLGRVEWVDDYPSPGKRREAAATLNAELAAWTSGRSAIEAFRELQGAGVAAAPSFTNLDLSEDAHLAARGVFVQMDHPVIGRQTVMRAPWLMSGTDLAPRRAGPLLGQDTRWMVEELLGDSPPEGTQWEEIFD
jgi:crotonobetainyl-CoA:carnitine CoA-transferase CaiB-like acyl-CoA transferase